MNTVNVLICLAGLAWAGQIALGWLQMRKFNEALAQLPAGDRVGIGRSGGRFTPRLLLVLSVDRDNSVSQAFIMKGITVFSRPVAEEKLLGMKLEHLNPEQLYPNSKAMRTALELAISNQRPR